MNVRNVVYVGTHCSALDFTITPTLAALAILMEPSGVMALALVLLFAILQKHASVLKRGRTDVTETQQRLVSASKHLVFVTVKNVQLKHRVAFPNGFILEGVVKCKTLLWFGVHIPTLAWFLKLPASALYVMTTLSALKMCATIMEIVLLSRFTLAVMTKKSAPRIFALQRAARMHFEMQALFATVPQKKALAPTRNLLWLREMD
jgi:hypothetical protein